MGHRDGMVRPRRWISLTLSAVALLALGTAAIPEDVTHGGGEDKSLPNDVASGSASRDVYAPSFYLAVVSEEKLPCEESKTSVVQVDEYSIEGRGGSGEKGIVMVHRESLSTVDEGGEGESSLVEGSALQRVIEETVVLNRDGNVESRRIRGGVVETIFLKADKSQGKERQGGNLRLADEDKSTNEHEPSVFRGAIVENEPIIISAIVSQAIALIICFVLRICTACNENDPSNVDEAPNFEAEDLRDGLKSGVALQFFEDGEDYDGECLDCLESCIPPEGEDVNREDDCTLDDVFDRDRWNGTASGRFAHVEYVPLGSSTY